MLGLMISCAFWACILVIIIQAFTDDEVSFSSVFWTSLTASIIAGILSALATYPMESAWLIFPTKLVIAALSTAVVVQIVVATDVKTIVKITLTYMAVQLVLGLILLFFVLPALGD